MTADICKQLEAGQKGISGVMIESNLKEGKQSSDGGRDSLEYGVSITDGCVSWEVSLVQSVCPIYPVMVTLTCIFFLQKTTLEMLDQLDQATAKRRQVVSSK